MSTDIFVASGYEKLTATGFLILSLIFAAIAAAEVYKTKDDQGRTVYTDRVPSGPAERVPIKTRTSDSQEAQARREEQRAAWQRADAERADRERDQATQQANRDAERIERCRTAQRQNAEFDLNRPKFRLDSQAKRVYYSSAEIEQKRAEAKQQMAEFCSRVKSAQ